MREAGAGEKCAEGRTLSGTGGEGSRVQWCVVVSKHNAPIKQIIIATSISALGFSTEDGGMDDPLSFIADVEALLTPEVLTRVPLLRGARGRQGVHEALLTAVEAAPPRGGAAVSLVTLVLRCAPALSGLSLARLVDIAQSDIAVLRLNEGDRLFHEGDQCAFGFLVLKGEVSEKRNMLWTINLFAPEADERTNLESVVTSSGDMVGSFIKFGRSDLTSGWAVSHGDSDILCIPISLLQPAAAGVRPNNDNHQPYLSSAGIPPPSSPRKSPADLDQVNATEADEEEEKDEEEAAKEEAEALEEGEELKKNFEQIKPVEHDTAEDDGEEAKLGMNGGDEKDATNAALTDKIQKSPPAQVIHSQAHVRMAPMSPLVKYRKNSGSSKRGKAHDRCQPEVQDNRPASPMDPWGQEASSSWAGGFGSKNDHTSDLLLSPSRLKQTKASSKKRNKSTHRRDKSSSSSSGSSSNTAAKRATTPVVTAEQEVERRRGRAARWQKAQAKQRRTAATWVAATPSHLKDDVDLISPATRLIQAMAFLDANYLSICNLGFRDKCARRWQQLQMSVSTLDEDACSRFNQDIGTIAEFAVGKAHQKIYELGQAAVSEILAIADATLYTENQRFLREQELQRTAIKRDLAVIWDCVLQSDGRQDASLPGQPRQSVTLTMDQFRPIIFELAQILAPNVAMDQVLAAYEIEFSYFSKGTQVLAYASFCSAVMRIVLSWCDIGDDVLALVRFLKNAMEDRMRAPTRVVYSRPAVSRKYVNSPAHLHSHTGRSSQRDRNRRSHKDGGGGPGLSTFQEDPIEAEISKYGSKVSDPAASASQINGGQQSERDKGGTRSEEALLQQEQLDKIRSRQASRQASRQSASRDVSGPRQVHWQSSHPRQHQLEEEGPSDQQEHELWTKRAYKRNLRRQRQRRASRGLRVDGRYSSSSSSSESSDSEDELECTSESCSIALWWRK